MEGGGYVCGAIELVIGVDGECGGVVRGLQRTGVFGVGDSGHDMGRRGGRHAWLSKHGVIYVRDVKCLQLARSSGSNGISRRIAELGLEVTELIHVQ